MMTGKQGNRLARFFERVFTRSAPTPASPFAGRDETLPVDEDPPGRCSRGALLTDAVAGLSLGDEVPEGAANVSVAVLVGGGSRRMGADKATVELAGKPMARYVIDAMAPLSEDLYLVGNDDGIYARFGLPVAADRRPVRSSLVGIYSALAAAGSDNCLVVPCDMPFADPELARMMLSLSPGYDAVVPVSPSGMEPLFALYNRRCLAVIDEFIAREDFKIINLLDRLSVRWVTPAEMRELRDPAVGFFNVNTPEDLRRAEGMLAAAGDGGRRTASAGNDRPPLVCFVGYKDSGKTTFLESLVADMAGRGLHVACIKHDTHGFVMDHEGTDTWRLSRAGADQVVISAPGQYASVARVERERSLEELRGEIDGSADIVLVEGFKGADADKIEVVGASGRLACDEAELMAVVADKPLAGVGLPLFERGDAGEVARFICARYGLSRRSVEDEQ